MKTDIIFKCIAFKIILILFSNCSPSNIYGELCNSCATNENRNKSILVFIYNKAECISCSGAFENIYKSVDTNLIPVTNFIILIRDTRVVEISEYKKKFYRISKDICFVSNSDSYEKLLSQIPLSNLQSSGFVVLSPNGKIIKATDIKIKTTMEEFLRYVSTKR